MQVLDLPAQEIVTLSPEGDASLPLGDSTKNFIRDEIKTQLAQAIDKFNPHGARKVAHFLREWGLAGTLVVAPIALLAFAGAGWYYAFNRVDKEARFQTTSDTRLKAIEDQLKEIRGDLAKQSIVNHAALPLADFKATLPDLSSALTTAKQQNAKVPAQVMGDLQDKLRASVDAPDFWPTAAQFISYRSQNTVPNLQNLVRDVPNCTDHEPSEATVDIPPGTVPTGPVGIIPSIYEKCQLTLDSPSDTDKINWLITHDHPFLEFRNCLITYHGGKVNLIVAFNDSRFTLKIKEVPFPMPMHGSARTIYFVDCIFNFSFTSSPPAEGQKITRTLLAQSANSATLNLGE